MRYMVQIIFHLKNKYKFDMIDASIKDEVTHLLKYQEIANTLRNQIQESSFKETEKLPTEEALCLEFGVSRQTIRHALSVLVQEGLIDRLQGSGSRLRNQAQPLPPPQRSIAVITTYISDYIFPSILREVETVLSRNNCTTMLYATQNQVVNERHVLKGLLVLPKLDGILVEGTKTALPNPNLDLYRKLIDRNIPLVFINGNYRELDGAISVLDDNYNGGYQLVKYLAAKGHKRISGMFKSDDIQGHQRYAGYTAALLDSGLSMEDAQLYWYNTETKEALAKGDNLYIEQMLAATKGCTAVVCYNDEIASYLLMALLNRGTKVPESIALVSFDNSRYSDVSPITITSLSHGDQNVGRLAAEALIKMLAGEKCDSQLAPWTLVEKGSS